MKDLLAKKVRMVYVFGEAAESMWNNWHSLVSCVRCKTLEEAVKKAFSASRPGDTLILSPGATAFDQFGNYALRGEKI